MHIIINNKEINIVNANSFIKRFKGLMFKKNINYGVLFKKCNSIHTFFMLEPIDIVVLIDNKVSTIKSITPWKIYISKSKKNKTSILELPKNTSQNLKINDYLKFK